MDKTVNVTLEKDGETQELSFKFDKMKQKAHAAKELAKFARKGWSLKCVSGSSEYVAAIKRLLGNYKTGDPVPIKSMMKESGLQVLPGFLKKHLTDQKEEEHPGPAGAGS